MDELNNLINRLKKYNIHKIKNIKIIKKEVLNTVLIDTDFVDTKIRFAKFIPLTETKTNIAAVVKVAALRPTMPSFSSMSIMMKPIRVP